MADEQREKTSKLTWAVLAVALLGMPILSLIDRYSPIGWMHQEAQPVARSVTATVVPKQLSAVYCTDNQGHSVQTHAEEGWELVKPLFSAPYYQSKAGAVFAIPPGQQCGIISD